MKIFIYSALFLFVLSGCIFTPPPGNEVYKEDSGQLDSEMIDLKESDTILAFAKAQLGTPYRYGGMSPQGFDCSGFVCYVYEHALGKKLPRTARAQSTYGQIVDKEDLEVGDLLFFDTSDSGYINHSGIYLGYGKFIHASSGSVYCVTVSKLNSGFYKRAFRWGGRIEHH